MNDKKANRLIKENSPYLLQHAYNPVDWYPWSDEAFQKAIAQNKPVFLSIGYSTCHWCHVMERETFENEGIAKYLNEHFISIKVDREERPDIDNIYMKACQILTGRGGWPLSVFITPQKKPFYAGTYFPPDNRNGHIGFNYLIKNISRAWENQKDDIENSSSELTKLLSDHNESIDDLHAYENYLHNAFNYFNNNYDNINGGFGSAPKFPSPHNLIFLLRYGKHFNNSSALQMVFYTLTKMRNGGIFDQLGFGFHRYSTDAAWLVPHFEKMLYDQALMITALSEAYLVNPHELFKTTVEEIVSYLINNLLSKEHAFYTAEDADSDGKEGTFYYWSKKEIITIIDPKHGEIFCSAFNVLSDGNFDNHSDIIPNINNILHYKDNANSISNKFGLSVNEFVLIIEDSRKKLLQYRNYRPRPFMDDKILTDWNGLIISSLAIASRIFTNNRFLELANQCYNFIISRQLNDNNKLFHCYRNGDASIEGSLDDYSFMIMASIEMYRTTFDETFLLNSIELSETVISYFWDNKEKGFCFTSSEQIDLITRTKETYDGAIPSGNSVMLNNLNILFKITGKTEYSIFANELNDYLLSRNKNHPQSVSFALSSFIYSINPSYELIICGNKEDKQVKSALEKLNSRYIPNLLTIFKDLSRNSSIEYLNNYTAINNRTTYYLCKNQICNLPTNNFNQILELLNN